MTYMKEAMNESKSTDLGGQSATVFFFNFICRSCHTIIFGFSVNGEKSVVFQDSESSMSEDTGLGSEESSSCEY